ncbi:DUF7694 domain-containing protein [Paenirhodobacter sp.]|uniref:DUF7694 domain-containing protein n=1 Tax=Paenirhodobacter sp. TaxID=1965326 RepID=UPI003D143176
MPPPGLPGKRAFILPEIPRGGCVSSGWDHVSVSLPRRCPNWEEMSFVKGMFFQDDETAMQLHVPLSQHINHHPYCLHLWRPHQFEIPRPPFWMVGPMPGRSGA